MTRHVGRESGLESERCYVTSVLPRGFLRGFVPFHSFSPARSIMIGAGLAATVLGYVFGSLGCVEFASRFIGTQS